MRFKKLHFRKQCNFTVTSIIHKHVLMQHQQYATGDRAMCCANCFSKDLAHVQGSHCTVKQHLWLRCALCTKWRCINCCPNSVYFSHATVNTPQTHRLLFNKRLGRVGWQEQDYSLSVRSQSHWRVNVLSSGSYSAAEFTAFVAEMVPCYLCYLTYCASDH